MNPPILNFYNSDSFNFEINCPYCKNEYGIFFDQYKKNCSDETHSKSSMNSFLASTHDVNNNETFITGKITSTVAIVRSPYVLSCSHRICNFCFENNQFEQNNTDSNNFRVYICPFCVKENPVDKLKPVQFNVDLNTLVYLSYNYQMRVKSDLNKFIMKCTYCCNYNANKNPTHFGRNSIDEIHQSSSKNQSLNSFLLNLDLEWKNSVELEMEKEAEVAELFCFGCLSVFCVTCFDTYHKQESFNLHRPAQISGIPTNTLPCSSHKNVLKFFCNQDRRFICSDCIIKSNHKRHTYVEIYSDTDRVAILNKWHYVFAQVKSDNTNFFNETNNQLKKLTRSCPAQPSSLNQAMKPVEDAIRCLVRKKNNLCQSLFIIEYILKEIINIKRHKDSLLFSYSSKESIEKVFDEYLKLVSFNNYQQNINLLSNQQSCLKMVCKCKSCFESNLNNGSNGTSSMISCANNNNLNFTNSGTNFHSFENFRGSKKKIHSNQSNRIIDHNNESIPNEFGLDFAPNRDKYKYHKNQKKRIASKNILNLNLSLNNELNLNESNLINGVEDLTINGDLKSSSLVSLMSSTNTIKKASCIIETSLNLAESSLKSGDIKLVNVVHFNNPSDFWIRFYSKRNAFETLNKKISKWAKLKESIIADEELLLLKIDDHVAHFVESLNNWLRAKIIQITENENEKDENDENNKRTFKLMFYDYGFVDNVESTHVRKLSKELLEEPQLAIHCYLHNLKPYEVTNVLTENSLNKSTELMENGEAETSNLSQSLNVEEQKINRLNYQWSEHANFLFTDWFINKTIELKVLSKIGDEYFGVDLINNLSDHMKSNQSTQSTTFFYNIKSWSICDIMTKWSVAQKENRNEQESLRRSSSDFVKKMPKFIPMSPLYSDENLIAGITHFDSLKEFYLKRLYLDSDSDDSYYRLVTRLQEEYNSENSKLYKIIDIVEGLPVAAFYEDDKKWYRAEVVKTYENSLMVDVVFIDYGNIKKISLQNLRYLKKDFLVDDVLTFRCKLFGLKFNDDESYEKASSYFFEKVKPIFTNNQKTMQVNVKNIIFDENTPSILKYVYEVVIRFPIDGKFTNINVLLTKLGFADSTNLSIFDGEKEVPKDKTSEVTIPKKTPLPTNLEKEVKEISNMPNKIFKSTTETKVLCKVTNAVSPSEIWVQDVVDSDNCYEKFQKLLAERYLLIYKEMKPQSWSNNALCVAKSPRKMEFFRAKILDRNSNGTYKVICLDNGNYMTNVNETDLFELIEEVREKPDFKAKKCFLIGVQPTGTTNGEWSSLAKTFTAETLNDNYVHVVFKSDKKANGCYDSCIYIDAKQKNEISILKSPKSPSMASMPDEDGYVRFVDILNSKGLAFLIEKKQPLDMLLANKTAFKSASLLTPVNQHKSYLSPVLHKKIQKFVDKSQEFFFETLVTHVDTSNADLYIHFIKMLETVHILNQMQYDFDNCYDTTKSQIVEEVRFSTEFLRETLKHKEYQACVCQYKGKYYRCELINEKPDLVNENSFKYQVRAIDYGFEAIVDPNKIYRPMIKYLDLPAQAYKMRLDTVSVNNIESNYADDLCQLVYNKLFKLKINSILDGGEELILVRDLYEKKADVWLTKVLSNNEKLFYEAAILYTIINKNPVLTEYLPFDSSSIYDNCSYNVLVTWVDDINKIWLQLGLNENDESKSNENEDLFREIIKASKLKFNSMQQEFQKLYESKSIRKLEMDEIEINKPCCCYFESEMFLYRAIILSVNYIENLAIVRYVDFGNEEEVKFENIFELDEKYLELAEQAVCCKLKNVCLNEEEQAKAESITKFKEQINSEFYNSIINVNESNFYAKFYLPTSENQHIIEVELFNGDPNNSKPSKLVYQSLIDKKLIVFK